MKRTWILGLVAAGSLLAAGAAQASNVQWSIGVNLPPVATVVSGGPAYYPASPVVYGPQVRYAPPVMVYDEPEYEVPTVVYREPRPYYRAPTVVYRSGRPFYDGRGTVGWHGDRDGRWAPVRGDRGDRGDRDGRDGRGHDHDDRGEQRRHH